jgi:hypothetical protein
MASLLLYRPENAKKWPTPETFLFLFSPSLSRGVVSVTSSVRLERGARIRVSALRVYVSGFVWFAGWLLLAAREGWRGLHRFLSAPWLHDSLCLGAFVSLGR